MVLFIKPLQIASPTQQNVSNMRPSGVVAGRAGQGNRGKRPPRIRREVSRLQDTEAAFEITSDFELTKTITVEGTR